MSNLSLQKLLVVVLFFSFMSLGWKKGDMVLAPWGGSYYQATIAAIKGNKANINYVDGDKATLDLSSLKPIAKPKKITVGLIVLAQWGTHSYYKAKVLKLTNKDCTVQFISDKTKHTVPNFKVFKF